MAKNTGIILAQFYLDCAAKADDKILAPFFVACAQAALAKPHKWSEDRRLAR